MSENNNENETFEEKPVQVVVTKKDDEKKKELEQQLEEKTLEAEDYKAKLQMIAEKEFERKKRELDAPDEIDTPEKLMAWELAKKGKKKEPSGVVPLSPAQLGQSGQEEPKSYSSYEEMLKDLHDQEKNGTPEEQAYAKAVLDELVRRSVKAVKSGKMIEDEETPKPDFKLEPKRKKRKD